MADRLTEFLECLSDNPFQRARIAGGWEAVPFTTKAELAADFAAHPPYGSNLTFPLSRYTRFCQTSGTTGAPLSILDTPESWEWMLGNWARIYREGGVKPGDVVYFAFSFGPFLGFWTAFEGAARYGARCIPGGGLSSAARLRAMAMHRADVLCCTPTYALHLAEVAARENLPARVAKIIVAGEPGGSIPAIRERISHAWGGAEVLDHYGMTEVGPVAYQKEKQPGSLHIIRESYLAEVVDTRTLAAVEDGSVGELVLTPLGRIAWPLLRYRTGDLVRKNGDELVGGIIGRADDMLVVRGVNIYPSAVDAVVRGIPEIAEYRVTVTKRSEMAEISLEIESPDDTAAARLERALTEAFTLRIPVVRTDGLPRFELKANRWSR
jgi:phenylacetate-CoA ligase